MESCAACGKGGSSLKSCKACQLVKYCGRECQIAHRSEHKKACRKRCAELFDNRLFAQPPARDEECPICMLILPFNEGEICFIACCGKSICMGCFICMESDRCPFCNANVGNHADLDCKLKERIEKHNDLVAMNSLGSYYMDGKGGYPVDPTKAVELYRRASELGGVHAHRNLARAYLVGRGIEMDKKKAIHHYQISSMMGDVLSRYCLGALEGQSGNIGPALRHWMIAAKCGHDDALEKVKQGYSMGLLTKDDFESTLRCHKAYQDEAKSEKRDKAKIILARMTRKCDEMKQIQIHADTAQEPNTRKKAAKLISL
eukprot:scaffold5629_cov48-Cyclotella_meneghiniana.AAC.1